MTCALQEAEFTNPKRFKRFVSESKAKLEVFFGAVDYFSNQFLFSCLVL